jgi:hypothetical protein
MFMKWVEMIELRSVENNRELLEPQLQQLIHDVSKDTHAPTIKVYKRVMIDTDVSIHLVHDSTHVERSGSPLGVRLASSLQEFGLVNHNVWVEIHSQ